MAIAPIKLTNIYGFNKISIVNYFRWYYSFIWLKITIIITEPKFPPILYKILTITIYTYSKSV